MSVTVQRLVAAVDLGSTKVTGIIGEVTGESRSWGLRILGVGVEPSTGLRRGVIRDFDETVRAEDQSRVRLRPPGSAAPMTVTRR